MRVRGGKQVLLVQCALLTCVLGASAHAWADEDAETTSVANVQIHGFASQGFILSTQNNYLAESKRGSFEMAEVGLNFTTTLTDRLRSGVQLFARDLGPIGDYRATVDWFYLDYRWRDWLGLRAGRIKLPFGLYNDISDIDAAHNVVLLPQSTYPTQNRDFLLAQTGFDLYGYHRTASAGALDYRLYGGTIFLETGDPPGRPFDVTRLTVPYVIGARLLWETPLEGLRAGGSVQALRLESELTFPMRADVVGVDVPAVLWVGSVEFSREDWLVAAEYGRWHVSTESSDPMFYPESKTVSERAYALASYRVKPWLQPSVYYSLLYPDTRERSGRAAQQHDVAAAIRYDVNFHWLVKLEAHYMHGTAALSTSLNDAPREDLASNWAVFLAKTTAHF